MNIENLTAEELKTLHTLIGKTLEERKQKVYLDPVDKYIDNIMDEFNFAKVLKTMEALDWKWALPNNSIPSMDDLREEAERLLRGAAESRLGEIWDESWESPIIYKTGGFQATAYCDKTKTRITHLDLKFIIEEWNDGEE